MRWVRAFLVLTVMVVIKTASAQPLPQIDEGAIRQAMEDRLKDADSAKFRKMEIFEDPKAAGMYVICGEVNAKNGYGAYSGYTPFMAFRIPIRPDGYSYYVLGVDEATGIVCKERKAGLL